MKNLNPKVFLSLNKSVPVFLHAGAGILARNFSQPVAGPKILNWRIHDTTVSEGLLNTDGESLLNTDGETLLNTGA